jgi:hypothetical protein
MKRIDPASLSYIAMALFAVVFSLLLLAMPVQQIKLVPVVQSKHHFLKVSPFTIRENVLVAAYRHGWTGAQWTCLRQLLDLEHYGKKIWSPTIRNPDSTASGIFQMLRSPSGVMFNKYSVDQQAKLGTKYIAHRYGTPCRALAFHRIHHYF